MRNICIFFALFASLREERVFCGSGSAGLGDRRINLTQYEEETNHGGTEIMDRNKYTTEVSSRSISLFSVSLW